MLVYLKVFQSFFSINAILLPVIELYLLLELASLVVEALLDVGLVEGSLLVVEVYVVEFDVVVDLDVVELWDYLLEELFAKFLEVMDVEVYLKFVFILQLVKL